MKQACFLCSHSLNLSWIRWPICSWICFSEAEAQEHLTEMREEGWYPVKSTHEYTASPSSTLMDLLRKIYALTLHFFHSHIACFWGTGYQTKQFFFLPFYSSYCRDFKNSLVAPLSKQDPGGTRMHLKFSILCPSSQVLLKEYKFKLNSSVFSSFHPCVHIWLCIPIVFNYQHWN